LSWQATGKAPFTDEQIEQLGRWLDEGLRSRMEIKDKYLVGMFLVPVLDEAANTIWMRKVAVLATHESVLTVDDTPEERPALEIDTIAARFMSCSDRSAPRWSTS
jgi:hypothetical protein